MSVSGIIFIRLITGEALVADVVKSTEDFCTLEKPAQITMQQVSPNPEDVKLGLVDFLPFAEKDKKSVSIEWSHILYTHEPTGGLRNAYSSMFGSGLIVPPGGTGPGLRSV